MRSWLRAMFGSEPSQTQLWSSPNTMVSCPVSDTCHRTCLKNHGFCTCLARRSYFGPRPSTYRAPSTYLKVASCLLKESLEAWLPESSGCLNSSYLNSGSLDRLLSKTGFPSKGTSLRVPASDLFGSGSLSGDPQLLASGTGPRQYPRGSCCGGHPCARGSRLFRKPVAHSLGYFESLLSLFWAFQVPQIAPHHGGRCISFQSSSSCDLTRHHNARVRENRLPVPRRRLEQGCVRIRTFYSAGRSCRTVNLRTAHAEGPLLRFRGF